MANATSLNNRNQNETNNNNNNNDNKKRRTFKSVGWYFTIGNYFASTIKQKRIFRSAFEDILSAHEGLAENLFADELSLTTSNNDSAQQRPPISDEMRSIVLDLNQFHLFDESAGTIKEEPPDEKEHLNRRPKSNTIKKRPRWNSIVGAKVMRPQRFLNSFSIELASKREQLEKENEAKHEAVKKRLPKISKTTEDLIVRRTNLDDKLRIMKLCHANGLQYNEKFVRTARHSYSTSATTSTSARTTSHYCRALTSSSSRSLKRSQSWQPGTVPNETLTIANVKMK